jgi:hypothetical protein
LIVMRPHSASRVVSQINKMTIVIQSLCREPIWMISPIGNAAPVRAEPGLRYNCIESNILLAPGFMPDR